MLLASESPTNHSQDIKQINYGWEGYTVHIPTHIFGLCALELGMVYERYILATKVYLLLTHCSSGHSPETARVPPSCQNFFTLEWRDFSVAPVDMK